MSSEQIPIHVMVREIIFKYRTTPLRNEKTPSEMYLGRQMRCNLDVLKSMILNGNKIKHLPSRTKKCGSSVQLLKSGVDYTI